MRENRAVPGGLTLIYRPTQDSASLRLGLTSLPPLRGSISAGSGAQAGIKLSIHTDV